MHKLSWSVLLLLLWQGTAQAACGYMPVIEVRNIGFDHIKDKYDSVTLYCPKAFLTVKTDNSSQQQGTLANNMLDDGKPGVCWLAATRNGQQQKLLSFTAKLECNNKDMQEWGKVTIISQVQYAPKMLCTEATFNCQAMQGPGLLISVGSEPRQKNPMNQKACTCPVTQF